MEPSQQPRTNDDILEKGEELIQSSRRLLADLDDVLSGSRQREQQADQGD